MPSPNWSDDDELMRDLTAALAVPAEERVLAAGRAAFAWRTVDTDLELMALLHDSLLEDAGMRGGARTLTFQHDDVGVEIELNPEGIEGQLIPAGAGLVTLVTPDGPYASTPADPVGFFSFPPPPGGPVRLECSTGSGRFVTDWITV